MEVKTHGRIDQELCGLPLELAEGSALIRFTAKPRMATDATGLVHGGFLFGAADYAAMLAVNHPNVVLGSAEVRFLKPFSVGETVLVSARVVEAEGKRRTVEVDAVREDEQVFSGRFVCFVPKHHVLAG